MKKSEKAFSHPLTKQWIEKMINKEELTFNDLMSYSLVSLRRKRMRKKFLKNPYRYISDNTHKIWMGCLVGNLVGNTFGKLTSLNLEAVEDEYSNITLPKVNLIYLDYQYKKQDGE